MRLASWLLGLAGVIVLLWSLLTQTYGCFMVTDPACPQTATARAVPFAIVGIALILVGIWVGIRRRRRGGAG